MKNTLAFLDGNIVVLILAMRHENTNVCDKLHTHIRNRITADQ